jgi:transposase
MREDKEIEVEDIDHLGLIAGIVDEIGIVEIINEILGTHELEVVSAGHIVKAMILNCLGFLTAPLYLFQKFFEGKATEHLIGEGVKAEHLNDSRLGRVLDQLYNQGLTNVFMVIALAALRKFGVESKIVHLDASSMCVQGEYENYNRNNTRRESQESQEPIPIEITHGYSRDHRPDLKQFTITMMTSGDGDIPIYFKVGNGNDSDQRVFTEVVAEFQNQWLGVSSSVYVADAALYHQENLIALESTPWISRVPASINEAQQLMQTIPSSMFTPSQINNYSTTEVCTTYAGIQQRWVIVESQSRLDSDLKQLDKRLESATSTQSKALKQLSNHGFACVADALDAAHQFNKKLKYHLLREIQVEKKPYYQKPGRPRRGEQPLGYTYHLHATLVINDQALLAQRTQAGRFILATNLLDSQDWSSDRILTEYKNQQSCERGFRFLKDPLFFASRLFVKLPQRVAALSLVMALCLLVYSIGQRQLRLHLAQLAQTIPNQKGKPTAKPTLRWVFQCFQSIHLIWLEGQKWHIKLNDLQRHILSFFGSASQQYYYLC